MPVSLRSALEVRFPSFRVPVVNDNLPFDIEYDKENGGDGCLGVAEGDYNGDGQQDRVLLLTAVTSQEDSRQVVLTVVGFGGQNGWQLEVLRDWGLYEPGRLIRFDRASWRIQTNRSSVGTT